MTPHDYLFQFCDDDNEASLDYMEFQEWKKEASLFERLPHKFSGCKEPVDMEGSYWETGSDESFEPYGKTKPHAWTQFIPGDVEG